MPLASWVERPLAVASALNRGECGGTYLEASLIISGALSAIASFAWPGKGKDRRRIVEAWVNYSGRADAKRISVPLLRVYLLTNNRQAEAEALARARPDAFGPGQGCRVLTGDDVDLVEDEVAGLCPLLERKKIREHAYATLFYEHVRCGLVQEGELGESATTFPMTTRDSGVSYGNWIDRPRTIHFAVPWLIDLSRDVAAGVDAAIAGAAPDPIAQPPLWWTSG